MPRQSKRHRQEVELEQLQVNVRKVWAYCRTLLKLPKQGRQESEAMHLLLTNALQNLENNMKKAGWALPEYVESRVVPRWERGEDVRSTYTPCFRCEFCKKQGPNLGRCTEFYIGPKREIYYVSSDDGCSRGLLRKEYR